MTREELREKVARAIAESEKFDWDNPEIADFHASFFRSADAAIALVLEEAEAAAVHALMPNKGASFAASKAIRALKG